MIPAMFKELSRRDILQLDPEECKRRLVKDELEMIFKACNAWWIHPEEKNPKAPHAILTTGKHSNGYINCPQVLCRSNLCQIMASQLSYLLESHFESSRINWVIGSDSSALGIAKDMANILKAKWHPMQKGPNKTQIWEKMTIRLGEQVLHVEELVTTSSTTMAVQNGLKRGNKHEILFVPFIPVLVFRPIKGMSNLINGNKYLPLLHYNIQAINPETEKCPYCEAGSKALPAKEHWDELTTTM